MKNKQFTQKLRACSKAHLKFSSLLKYCEDELVSRYGVHPSDLDNDIWIDNFHINPGFMTIQQIEDSYEDYSNVKIKRTTQRGDNSNVTT